MDDMNAVGLVELSSIATGYLVQATLLKASNVRVLIESTDGTRYWRTVGSSTDII